jgi:hypothetical protein
VDNNLNSPDITIENEDGTVTVFSPMTASMKTRLVEAGVDVPTNGGEPLMASTTRWPEGQIIYPGMRLGTMDAKYRQPRMSIPQDFYTQAEWSREFYDSEPLVNSLVNRDIDQAVTDEEFQMPEDEVGPKGALQKWRGRLNKPLGQQGGLSEYNRSLAKTVVLSGLTITYANWGYIAHKGKTYEMPINLINLSHRSLVPDIDAFTGQRHYYYRLSEKQVQDIKKTRKNTVNKPGIMQVIPDAKERIVTDITFIKDKLEPELLGHSAHWITNVGNGGWLDLPLEDAYIINHRAGQNDLWPVPALVPIFPAIAMKRKLHMADWAVADGMINMIVVWTFPPGTSASDGQSFVSKFVSGGRVQSQALPDGVKVEIVTPPTDMLNSSERFWIPVSEIYAHFGFPLNSKSRGAGDLDSGPLDQASNRARLDVLRETIEDHNNFFLRQIAERNGWDFDLWAILQTRDLDSDANFRTFATSLYDRGLLSIETMLDLAKTSMERERARREKERKEGLDEVFEIRPSFAQGVVGTAGDGRPPESSSPPSSGTGDASKGLGLKERDRPTTTAKVAKV